MSQGRAMPRSLLLGALFLGACALSADPVDDVLKPPVTGTEATPSSPASRLAALDTRCSAALEAARGTPQDDALALAASRALFEAADLRLQLGTLAALDAEKPTELAEVLTADDRVDAAAQAAILSLASEGLALADRVIEQSEASVEAQLFRALHLSLVAWANGPTRSLFAGYGPKLVAAMDRAVELDAGYDGGAPLRLRGRFRSKAPWPYGDLDQAREALLRAAELAPVPVTLLFLGDLHEARGERELALAAWGRASSAEPDVSTRESAPEIRELAQRRLRAIAPQGAATPR
jgi:tetratricopeptide (TPR) repeat protein